MLTLQLRKIGVVCFEFAEILDPPGKLGTRGQMLSSIAVALRSGLSQREIDHRAQRHCRGQRMLLGQCLRRELTSNGYALQFSGPETRRGGLMDYVQRWFGEE